MVYGFNDDKSRQELGKTLTLDKNFSIHTFSTAQVAIFSTSITAAVPANSINAYSPNNMACDGYVAVGIVSAYLDGDGGTVVHLDGFELTPEATTGPGTDNFGVKFVLSNTSGNNISNVDIHFGVLLVRKDILEV